MKFLVLILTSIFLISCTHLSSVSTSAIPTNRSKPVSAQGERFMFMLFNFDNKYVDNMVMDMARQCPKGRIEGILTKYEVTTYFPLFAYNLKASAQGYCVGQN